ncbi:MAG: serine hydrolase domain-containing protein [Bryobacteraceae bacterium]
MKRFAIGLLLTALVGAAAELGTAKPEYVGLSPDRLQRIAPVMQKWIEEGKVAGAVGLISRRGRVAYFESYGSMDRESKKPMPKDAIFRIYSMTKAVTGVAVMILAEEGRFSILDPVSRYLPEFAHMQVAVEEKDSSGKAATHTVAATKQITIRDLLRHTSGLNYAGPRGEDGSFGLAKARAATAGQDLAAVIRAFAAVPLLREPGTAFDYSYSIDVLGRLVEVVSGTTLEEFFSKRIFEPLGMKDTGFFVPEEKWSRLATLYRPTADASLVRISGGPQDSFKKKPSAFMGGEGLTSTARDYARFCQMLLNNGTLDGARILGRKTVELMHADHIEGLPRVGTTLPAGFGFGLTFAVNPGVGKTGVPGSEGEYYWGGAAGTRFWLDPAEQMFGVFMVQILPNGTLPYAERFRQMAYQAIVD